MSTETTTKPRPPQDGMWVILHWQAPPHVMKLDGQFSAGNLRWLADRLDAHNESLTDE